jgi:hypothetical protein
MDMKQDAHTKISVFGKMAGGNVAYSTLFFCRRLLKQFNQRIVSPNHEQHRTTDPRIWQQVGSAITGAIPSHGELQLEGHNAGLFN